MEQKKFTKVKYDTIFKILSSNKNKKDYKIENNQLYYKNLKVIHNDNITNILKELYKQYPYER
jgi:hypothetical protein